MTNASGLRIAVVGVSSLIGEAVIDELRARKMVFAELHALDDERSVGRSVASAEGADIASIAIEPREAMGVNTKEHLELLHKL